MRLGLVNDTALDVERVKAAWEPTLFVDEPAVAARVTARSAPEEKVALFRSLFAGRVDVYATRWTNRTGRSGWSPAVVGGPANARRPDRQYLPLTDEVIAAHLTGNTHVGLYPLVPDDNCRLLACDFDGSTWQLDARAFVDAARGAQIPVALERSQSGDGGHVWMFFTGPVHASAARRLAAYLLREAMTVRAELDLASYDRFFPAQDFMPKGSFGNLIGLPLQGVARRRGTTVFLDPATLELYPDQWAYLSSLARSTPAAIRSTAEAIGEIAAGPMEPAFLPPRASAIKHPVPAVIRADVGAMLEIDRIGIPPALLASLKHLASLRNPAYHEKERLRLSTWRTPRFVRSYSETIDRLLLPRGLRESAETLVEAAGSRLDVRERTRGDGTLDATLQAELTPGQRTAFDSLVEHDLGVLVAPPGAGKTVVACAVIAARGTPTLVLVDRQPLLDQWRDRLMAHLGLKRNQIGLVGSGRSRPRGSVDVAMIQSLARRDDVARVTAPYGLVIVDECHHVPAVTFERVVREIDAPAWLGLTATPYRRDGLEGLITMYCGPVRHRMGSREASEPEFTRLLTVHQMSHGAVGARSDGHVPPDATSIQDVFRGLTEDDIRTNQIAADVVAAARAGRNCLVLSQWTQHLARIGDSLDTHGIHADVLQGGVGKRARREIADRLAAARPGDGTVLLASGSFLGEGFDCPPLDTLFLTFPIAFKGRLVQYVGRVLRPVAGKSTVEVHDYVDGGVPVLARMHRKRLSTYASLGFAVHEAEPLFGAPAPMATRGPAGGSPVDGQVD